LRYADSIWRGGEDDWHAGVGTEREQWITYRDQQTYENIVRRAAVSDQLADAPRHHLCAEEHAPQYRPGHDFANEVHSYFATGTQLQEMYITPSLLSKAGLGHAGRSGEVVARNADVLRDTHWIGGDPGRLDVYGWARGRRSKGDHHAAQSGRAHAQTAVIDLQRQLELPRARRVSSRA
jgi:hypothetical protein